MEKIINATLTSLAGSQVYLATEDEPDFSKLPNGVSYVLAGNGLLSVTKNRRSIVVANASALGLDAPEIAPGFKWNGPKVDSVTYAFIDSLFYSVFEALGTEAVVLLYLDSKDRWFVRVPTQTVSAALVEWEEGPSYWFAGGKPVKEPAPGSVELVGTAHSHGSMKAFPSGVDNEDNESLPGFHLIFGGYQKDIYSRLSGGSAFTEVEPESLVDFVGTRVKMDIPDNITRRSYTPAYSGKLLYANHKTVTKPSANNKATTASPFAGESKAELKQRYGEIDSPEELDEMLWADGYEYATAEDYLDYIG